MQHETNINSLPLTKGECPQGEGVLYTEEYNTNRYNEPKLECFICGRHESKSNKLRSIRRWKTVSRKVILIIDSVCSVCDDKHKLISSKPNAHNQK